ncbi:MAG: PH domain-containing protein [Firmicutes bacterium]|nr:PH domain-containing protein [Bacillota bacterium]
MAYMKTKEITKYFYFYKELDIKELPKYVTDYIDSDEKILCAYATRRDKGVFTDKKILLFDVKGLSLTSKQIHTIPYNSVSSLAVMFDLSRAELIFYLDSGYPLVLKFRNMNGEAKGKLRVLYSEISKIIRNKK